MSFNINLGGWGSVFAVPSKVVDEGLKCSSAYQLKVLLYLLRNCDKELTNEEIGSALDIHPADVKDAILYWIDKGLLSQNGEEIIPAKQAAYGKKNVRRETKEKIQASSEDAFARNASKPAMPRPQKPTHAHIAQLVCNDKTLVDLLNEVQSALGKTLSNSDTATIVYLYETCGLSAPVIMMLVQYCISIDKQNMRTIERIGIQWSDEGILTVQAAEEKIRSAKNTGRNFARVASVFGIHNAGSPSAKQLAYADKWVEQWKFSDEMLREAYERCVDTKGEMKLSYIDGILKRWHQERVFRLEDIPNTKRTRKAPAKAQGQPAAQASYDIEELENRSFFDE